MRSQSQTDKSKTKTNECTNILYCIYVYSNRIIMCRRDKFSGIFHTKRGKFRTSIVCTIICLLVINCHLYLCSAVSAETGVHETTELWSPWLDRIAGMLVLHLVRYAYLNTNHGRNGLVYVHVEGDARGFVQLYAPRISCTDEQYQLDSYTDRSIYRVEKISH